MTLAIRDLKSPFRIYKSQSRHPMFAPCAVGLNPQTILYSRRDIDMLWGTIEQRVYINMKYDMSL